MLKKIVGKIWKRMTPDVRVRIVRVSQPKFTVSAAAVIVNESGKVLLLDHVLRPNSNWGIPGGFIKIDEAPEKAVCREIFEETGLELKNVKLVRVQTYKRHVEILYRADASGKPEVNSSEINAAVWFDIDRIPEEMSEYQKADVREFC